MPRGRKRNYSIELKPDNEAVSITLNMSMKAKSYIDTKTTNRSEWIKEAGHDFLDLLYTFCLPLLSQKTIGRKIISVSKPNTNDLEDIYNMVKERDVFFSRSEFYRIAVIIKIIFETIKDMDIEKLQTNKEMNHKEGIALIPTGRFENGEEVFKIYKILKRLEY